MQHVSQDSQTIPPRIEPTGFFSGVKIVPVIIGIVVDYFATHLILAAFLLGYVAKKAGEHGELGEDAVAAYMQSTEGLTAMLIIGCLGTALGGFIAARRAGTLHIKHGAFVGVGSLIVSFVQLALQEAGIQPPEWFTFTSVVAIIPAGALGGYVAELFAGRSATPPKPS
jgi:putative membrane protein (TIGR04086 family)